MIDTNVQNKFISWLKLDHFRETVNYYFYRISNQIAFFLAICSILNKTENHEINHKLKPQKLTLLLNTNSTY